MLGGPKIQRQRIIEINCFPARKASSEECFGTFLPENEVKIVSTRREILLLMLLLGEIISIAIKFK